MQCLHHATAKPAPPGGTEHLPSASTVLSRYQATSRTVILASSQYIGTTIPLADLAQALAIHFSFFARFRVFVCSGECADGRALFHVCVLFLFQGGGLVPLHRRGPPPQLPPHSTIIAALHKPKSPYNRAPPRNSRQAENDLVTWSSKWRRHFESKW